ncbi:MAG: alpha/beta fold hydrolase [Lapillicoccus sp.]
MSPGGRQYAALLALLLLAACGAPGPTTAAPATTAAPPTAASTTLSATTGTPTSATATPTTATGTPTTTMGRRCGGPDAETTSDTVPGPAGEGLSVVTVGRGPTVALLLHQTDRVASCGWWRFANRLADQGVRAVLLDFCDYGTSTCGTAWAGDYTDQVARTVARLRDTGATRVTVVGASLGGTVAAVSASVARPDAVVDLSGFGFGPMTTGPALAALTVPVLGAGSHDEESDSQKLKSEVLASASPVTRFLWDTSGHGVSLVLDGPTRDAPTSAIGRAVIGWVKGDYAA